MDGEIIGFIQFHDEFQQTAFEKSAINRDFYRAY